MEADSNEFIAPMTTLIGIKCVDGIVSDSQATYKFEGTKDLDVNKISVVKNTLTIGGAGNANNIRLLIEELETHASDEPLSDKDTLELIRKTVLGLHKKYNTDQIPYLGDKARDLFKPTVVIGAQLKDSNFGLYLVDSNAMIYPVEDKVLGQGAPLARLVMKQLNRSLKVFGISLSKLSVEHLVKLACYIINEVKESDNVTGGLTKVTQIDASGAKSLSDDEISNTYDDFVKAMSFGMGRLLEASDKPLDWFRGALPKP